jgi:hypothetical protein
MVPLKLRIIGNKLKLIKICSGVDAGILMG